MTDKQDNRTGSTENLRTSPETEEMKRDRTYEEKFAGYYGSIDPNAYVRSGEDLEEMARELPLWDILPPRQQD